MEIRVVEFRHDPLVDPAREPIEDLKLYVRRWRLVWQTAHEGLTHTLTKWPILSDQPGSALQFIDVQFEIDCSRGHASS